MSLALVGWITSGLLVVLFVFQLLLALGVPIGHMAWGGGTRVLPGRLRFASLVVSALLLACVFAVSRLVFGLPAVMPDALASVLVWLLAAVMTLSIVGNVMSSSRAERAFGVPMSIALAVGLAWVAWST